MEGIDSKLSKNTIAACLEVLRKIENIHYDGTLPAQRI